MQIDEKIQSIMQFNEKNRRNYLYFSDFMNSFFTNLLTGSNTDCTDNITEWRNDPSNERCPEEDWLPPVIAAFYMMLTQWLLLNIVIAMFRYYKKSNVST